MSEPNQNLHVLQPYRDKPLEIRYRKGEHLAVCRWCKWGKYRWRTIREGMQCANPRLVSRSSDTGRESASMHNDCGRQCNDYQPSLWTRLLQWLRLRPRVERPHDETEGT